MATKVCFLLLFGMCVFFHTKDIYAQSQPPQPAAPPVTYTSQVPTFGAGHDYIRMLGETVNPANGSVSLRINIPVPEGRGLIPGIGIGYDSASVYSAQAPGVYPVLNANSATVAVGFTPSNAVGAQFTFLMAGTNDVMGWSILTPSLSASRSYYTNYAGTATCFYSQGFTFTDSLGQKHSFGIVINDAAEGSDASLCPSEAQPTPGYSSPSYVFSVSTDGEYQGAFVADGPINITAADGTTYMFSYPFTNSGGGCFTVGGAVSGTTQSLCEQVGNSAIYPQRIEDRNGNEINTVNNSGYPLPDFFDALGRNAVSLKETTSGGNIATTEVSISGIPNSYVLNWNNLASSSLSLPWQLLPGSLSGYTCNSGGPSSSNQTSSSMPTSLSLPDGTSYQFQYDPASGLLNKITYPSGAYVSYVWGSPGSVSDQANYTWSSGHQGTDEDYNEDYTSITCLVRYAVPVLLHRYVSFNGTNIMLQQDFSYTTTFGMPIGDLEGYWTAKTTSVVTRDLVTGTSYSTLYTYSPAGQMSLPSITLGDGPTSFQSGGPPALEASIQVVDSTGKILHTTNKQWLDPSHPTMVQDVLDNGQTSETDYFYNTPGYQLTEEDNYDYGTAGRGALLRSRVYSYATFGTTPIFPGESTSGTTVASLFSFPSKIAVYDKNGTLASETDYGYDESSVLSATATSHDDNLYGATSSAQRANVTSIIRKCFPGCSDAKTTMAYDSTGQVILLIDPNGQNNGAFTQFSYIDSFAIGTGQPTANTNAFPTRKIAPSVNGVAQVTVAQFGFNDSLVRSITDSNNQTTTYCYTTGGCGESGTDPWLRLSQVKFADGGLKTATYVDTSSSPSTTISEELSTNTTMSMTTFFDGLVHAVQSQQSDPCGADSTDTTYDGESLIRTISNPYRGASVCSFTNTFGDMTFHYDALKRKFEEDNQDGTTKLWSFLGNQTAYTDESLNSWSRATDSLGREVSISEPGNLITNYGYDPLGNLVSVNQFGNTGATPQTRSFTYDSLSRLLTSTNPETGLICYGQWSGGSVGSGTCQNGYDANGNLLYKTDARGIVTSYSYDALNRLTSRSYSDGTPGAILNYDETGDWGASSCGGAGFMQCNTIGRLSSMKTSDGVTASIFSYDALGRTTMKSSCFATDCAGVGAGVANHIDQYFAYDLAGNPLSSDHGNDNARNRAYGSEQMSYDSAGRLQAASFVQGTSSPSPLFSATSYGPVGLLNSTLGNGLNEVRSYDVRTRQVSYNVLNESPSSAASTTLGNVETIENYDLVRFPNLSIPASSLPQNGTIEVIGWAGQTASCPLAAVEIDLDQVAIGYAALGNARPDVQSVIYNNDGMHSNCGFLFSGSIGDASAESHTITAYGIDTNGNRTPIGSSASNSITVTAQAPPSGSVDTYPQSNLPTGGLLNATGWAIDSQMHAPVGAVKVLIDGNPVGYATLNQQRADVAAYFNDQRYLNSGWTFTGGIGNIALGSHAVTYAIYDSGGQSTVLTNSAYTINVVADTAASEVSGSLDYTAPAITINSTSYISGWAGETANTTACASNISRVDVLIDGQVLGQAQTGTARPDVASSFNNPSCQNAGFAYSGPIANVDPGVHAITVRAYDENGGSVQVGGTQTLQINAVLSSTSVGSTLPSQYAWSLGYTPNGNVSNSYDSVNGNNAAIYDNLNRLTAATWGNGNAYQWTYDSFGNRLSQTPLAGTGVTLSNTFSNGNNRADGYAYDAAGNALTDETRILQFGYDAESRLSSVGSTQYIYDAEGQRVAKGSGGTYTNFYLYDNAGHIVTALDGSFNLVRKEVFAGSRHLGTYDASGNLTYALTDWLGTTRAVSNSSGVICQTITSQPFGGEQQQNGSCFPSPVFFTGKERDAESGLDYFGARYYASSMGRWMSPDWSAKIEPVPYAKLDNPQSLNLYAYVGNNPLSRVDPTGHADIAAECKGQATCNKTLVQTVNIVHQDKNGNTVTDSTLKVTTNFSLTTDAKGNVSTSASSTVANVSGLKFSDSQLATMGKDIGTMQQAAVGMGFGQNTTELVTAVGAAESHFGASPPYAGAPSYMNPAINPMQLTGRNGATTDLNHNVEGGMGILDWAGRPSTFDPTATYTRYSDHSPTTMSNWNAIYGSINETQP